MAERFTVWNQITGVSHDRRLNVNWDRAFHQNLRTTRNIPEQQAHQPT